MDDMVVRKLVRQLRWLNGLVTFFGLLIVAALIAAGVLLFKAASYLHGAEQSIQKLQTNTSQTLHAQDQACSNPQASSLLKQYTSLCQ